MSYTRPPNLEEILCRAKLCKTRQGMGTRGAQPGFSRCGDRRCSLCPFTGRASDGRRVSHILVKHSGQMETIKDSLNCKSSNVLYLLSCEQQTGANVCGQQYVGETGRQVKRRFSEHKGSMEEVDTSKVIEKHFQERGRRGQVDCTMVPFLKVKSSDPFVRKCLETYYINKFNINEKGLNVKLG